MARAEGKVAIVTGGGAGIGRSCCLRLAEEGARVVATDISEERGEETVEQIKQNGGEALFLGHDVTQEDQWESVLKEINETDLRWCRYPRQQRRHLPDQAPGRDHS